MFFVFPKQFCCPQYSVRSSAINCTIVRNIADDRTLYCARQKAEGIRKYDWREIKALEGVYQNKTGALKPNRKEERICCTDTKKERIFSDTLFWIFEDQEYDSVNLYKIKTLLDKLMMYQLF